VAAGTAPARMSAAATVAMQAPDLKAGFTAKSVILAYVSTRLESRICPPKRDYGTKPAAALWRSLRAVSLLSGQFDLAHGQAYLIMGKPKTAFYRPTRRQGVEAPYNGIRTMKKPPARWSAPGLPVEKILAGSQPFEPIRKNVAAL